MVNAPVTEAEMERVRGGEKALVVSPSGDVARWEWTRGGLAICTTGHHVVYSENAKANEEGSPQSTPF